MTLFAGWVCTNGAWAHALLVLEEALPMSQEAASAKHAAQASTQMALPLPIAVHVLLALIQLRWGQTPAQRAGNATQAPIQDKRQLLLASHALPVLLAPFRGQGHPVALPATWGTMLSWGGRAPA